MTTYGRSYLNSTDTTRTVGSHNRFSGNERRTFGHHDARRNFPNDFENVANEKPSEPVVINACMMGNLSLIEEYLESGHDVNEFLMTGWTLLLYAASYAQPEIIHRLLTLGGNPNLHQEGFTPLMTLCGSNRGSPQKRMKCLQHLIEAKADVNAANKLKETALMHACKLQEIDFISELLKHVANIDFADSEQRTALFYATSANRYDVVKLLIEKEADISWINYRGFNAYDIAVTKAYDKLIPLLTLVNDEEEQNVIKTNNVSSWLDMFSTMPKVDINEVDSDVASMLYGMGLESYNPCFRGIDLATFLKLTEEGLANLGVDISIHRKKFVDELFRFHKHEWKNNLIKADHSKSLSPFEAIKILGNLNKQLSVMSSSVYYAKNCLNSIEMNGESRLSQEDEEKLKNEIERVQLVIQRIKKAMSRVQILAGIIKERNPDLTLPTYIERKSKKNNRKWILITFIAVASFYLYRIKSTRRLLNNEKTSSRNWKNIFYFPLSNVLYDKICTAGLLLHNRLRFH